MIDNFQMGRGISLDLHAWNDVVLTQVARAKSTDSATKRNADKLTLEELAAKRVKLDAYNREVKKHIVFRMLAFEKCFKGVHPSGQQI